MADSDVKNSLGAFRGFRRPVKPLGMEKKISIEACFCGKGTHNFKRQENYGEN